jgi:hypothetical protein
MSEDLGCKCAVGYICAQHSEEKSGGTGVNPMPDPNTHPCPNHGPDMKCSLMSESWARHEVLSMR